MLELRLLLENTGHCQLDILGEVEDLGDKTPKTLLEELKNKIDAAVHRIFACGFSSEVFFGGQFDQAFVEHSGQVWDSLANYFERCKRDLENQRGGKTYSHNSSWRSALCKIKQMARSLGIALAFPQHPGHYALAENDRSAPKRQIDLITYPLRLQSDSHGFLHCQWEEGDLPKKIREALKQSGLSHRPIKSFANFYKKHRKTVMVQGTIPHLLNALKNGKIEKALQAVKNCSNIPLVTVRESSPQKTEKPQEEKTFLPAKDAPKKKSRVKTEEPAEISPPKRQKQEEQSHLENKVFSRKPSQRKGLRPHPQEAIATEAANSLASLFSHSPSLPDPLTHEAEAKSRSSENMRVDPIDRFLF